MTMPGRYHGMVDMFQRAAGIGWWCQSTTRRAHLRRRAPWAWAAPICASTPWSRLEVRKNGQVGLGGVVETSVHGSTCQHGPSTARA